MSPDEENAAELARFAERAKEWGWGLKPYVGPTHGIDLDKPWFCPNCRMPLRLVEVFRDSKDEAPQRGRKSKAQTLPKMALYRFLSCPNHPEVCEYDFHGPEARRLAGVWWSAGFKYPLSQNDLDRLAIETLESRLKGCRETIDNKKQEIKEIEAELVTRKAALIG
ncbi:hypothetical protein NTE19_003396 [Vibrio fluvialis]|nr:hypothetical protein [Vibrio fluvialis]